jgi:hypothetical protein
VALERKWRYAEREYTRHLGICFPTGRNAELELGGPRVGHPRAGRSRVASRRVPPVVLANATIVFSAREVPHPFLQTTSCLIVDATSSRVIQETSVVPMGFGSNSSVLTMRKCWGR